MKRLYLALLKDERATRSSIGADTRLSGRALGSVLNDLVSRGAVIVADDDTPGLRGPKHRYKLNKDSGRVLAFGFSYDRLGVAITDLSGAMLQGADYLVDPGREGWVARDPAGALSEASRIAHEAMNRTQTDLKTLVGVGVSFPGPILTRTGPYRGSMINWHSHDIAEELQRLTGLPESIPIEVESDSNLIATWEHRHGAARESSHVCVVQWGPRLGAGLIIDNQIYRGPDGLAGEIGHVHTTARLEDAYPQDTGGASAPIGVELPRCTRCGRRCLEALIGSGILLHELKRLQLKFHDIGDATTTIQREQRKDAQDLFRRAGHLLGHKLAPIVSALNLRLVVVDSFGHPTAHPLVRDGLRTGLRQWMSPDAFEKLIIRPADCDRKGSILGATDLVLDRHLGRWAGRLP